MRKLTPEQSRLSGLMDECCESIETSRQTLQSKQDLTAAAVVELEQKLVETGDLLAMLRQRYDELNKELAVEVQRMKASLAPRLTERDEKEEADYATAQSRSGR